MYHAFDNSFNEHVLQHIHMYDTRLINDDKRVGPLPVVTDLQGAHKAFQRAHAASPSDHAATPCLLDYTSSVDVVRGRKDVVLQPQELKQQLQAALDEVDAVRFVV